MLRAMLAAPLVVIVLAGTAPAGDRLDARWSAEPYQIAQAAPADRPAGIAPDTIVERDPRGRGIAFSGTIGGRSDEWRWVRARRGEVPDGAFVAGFEPGAEHYVCRGDYKGNVLPGNLIAGENACSIGHRGREIRTKVYEVLTGTEDEFTWVAAARGTAPEGAFKGGEEDGRTLYVCRAVIGEEFDYPGKLTARSCDVAWNGKEHAMAEYEVLVKR